MTWPIVFLSQALNRAMPIQYILIIKASADILNRCLIHLPKILLPFPE